LKGIDNFSFSIETHLIRAEEQVHQEKNLKQQLDKLSSVQREVIFHRFFGGLSIDDIAKMMELPKKSIYNALAKGISSLRKAFK
jgi:RNA polymerase sigma factor (sigma-70 family)